MITKLLQAGTLDVRPYRRYDHMDDGWGYWMWFGGALWLVLLIGLVALVVWLIVRSQAAPPSASEARRILAERFARGEIDEEDYRRRSDLLH